MKQSTAIHGPTVIRVHPANGDCQPVGLSVRSNGIWSLVGNGVFAASQFGMLVVMARLGTQELVGTYALGLALVTPVFVLFSLQLRTLFATHAGDRVDVGTYVGVRVVTTAAALLIAAAIGWRFMPAGTAGVALALALSKAIDLFHDLAYAVHYRRHRMDVMTKSQLLRGITGLTAFAVTFYYTASPAIGVLALCGAWIAIFFVYDLPTAWREMPVHARAWTGWSWTTASRLVWLGVPGGILSWLVALQTSVPRYLIQQDVGEAALGVYSAIASLFVGLELAVVSFNQAAVPQMACYAAQRESVALARLVRQLTIFGVGLGCLFVVAALCWGPMLLGRLFGSTYAAHADVLAILTIGFAIRTATMPTGMTLRAINAFWPLVAVQFSAVIAVVAACLVLMPRFGLAGCAAACVVGYAFDSLGRVALHFQLVARPKEPVVLAIERLQAA